MEEFWRVSSSAALFRDVDYGQWGLEILSPGEAAKATLDFQAARPSDFQAFDLIVGRFLGDSDLLLLRCDAKEEDFGAMLIALPIDKRESWHEAADSLAEFLENMKAADGDNYWEVRGE